jgi:hypothetical protein
MADEIDEQIVHARLELHACAIAKQQTPVLVERVVADDPSLTERRAPARSSSEI